MKKKVILIVISVFLTTGILCALEEAPGDQWIRHQVELQYSSKVAAPGRTPADFSFCLDEIRAFEKEKGSLFEFLLKGREAVSILSLYEKGYIHPEVMMEHLSNMNFRIISAGLPRETLSVRDVVLYYLWQMKRSQDKGMNIILTVNAEVLKEAEYWDNLRKEMDMYPLYGLPVALKANIGTADGQPTSAGAKALEHSFAVQDATLVRKIKEAGGLIIAKTNLSEWANYMTENSANGFSALGGQTRNPYGAFDVGGSSSGSAAAVAQGLVPLAVGTETSGSIVYPSSQNSVVGLKPTVGLISRNSIIPIAEAQDTAGPITTTVRDAALLLNVMAGEDPLDPATDICRKIHKDYRFSGEKSTALQGLRLGFVSNPSMRHYYYRQEEGAIQLRIIGELIRAGAEVVFIEMDETIYTRLDVGSVFQYQFHQGVNEYLKKWARGEGPLTLDEIIAFNRKNPAERMPLGQGLLVAARDNEHTEEEIAALVLSNAREAGGMIDALLKEHHVHLLFTLSNHLSYIYAAAGYPALCVPAGYKRSGEPVGVTFVGSRGDEVILLKAGSGYEQAVPHRIIPE